MKIWIFIQISIDWYQTLCKEIYVWMQECSSLFLPPQPNPVILSYRNRLIKSRNAFDPFVKNPVKKTQRRNAICSVSFSFWLAVHFALNPGILVLLNQAFNVAEVRSRHITRHRVFHGTARIAEFQRLLVVFIFQ